jgi:hypothetical protein
VLNACSDKDEPNKEPVAKATYALLTGDMTQAPYMGYLSTHAAIPSGNVDNIKSGSLSIRTNGMRYSGKWIFKREIYAGQSSSDGIRRYSIDEASGNLQESGFINSGGDCNFFVYDDAAGFYVDLNRGLLTIQKFNPSTMERTGEIDLTGKIASEGFEYYAVGRSLITGKDGKLFVDITRGTATGKGAFMYDPPTGYVELAVIDIASGAYEKTIRYDGIKYLGYPANENQMWSTGDDGALYLCSHGITGPLPSITVSGSAIVRIKKGETDFDRNWIIRADDYQQSSCFAVVCVKDGRLYTQISTQEWSVMGTATDVIYDYYAFETANPSKAPVKIQGMPQSTFVFQSGQGIIAMDGKVYFRVVNPAAGKNGYYALGDNHTASEAFNVTNGGVVWGFVKLTE